MIDFPKDSLTPASCLVWTGLPPTDGYKQGSSHSACGFPLNPPPTPITSWSHSFSSGDTWVRTSQAQLRERAVTSRLELWSGLVSWPCCGRREDTSIRLHHYSNKESTNSSVSSPPSSLCLQDFSGGPVVKISASKARGIVSISGWGTKIPHASWPKIIK